MILSKGTLSFYVNEGWIPLELTSCDITYSQSQSRDNWNREGIFTNEVIDNIEINFVKGVNPEWDSLLPGDTVKLRWNNGAIYFITEFIIGQKYNTKLSDGTTNTFERLTTTNDKVTLQGIGGEGGGVSQDYVDEQDQSVLKTCRGELETAVDKATEAINSLNDYCNELNETKLDEISYVELSGKSGTLTDEQRSSLLSGSPTLNFIDKDGMLFKCVYYQAGTKAVYSIAGESKIHVIEVTLPAGTWALTTYELAQPYTAGDNITIKNNVISATSQEPDAYLKTITKTEDGVVTITDKEGTATTFQTGGGSGGVSQDYVDQQDQAILATTEERLKEESVERANMDSTLYEAISNESEKRSQSFNTLSTALTNETTNRTEADNQLQTNIDNEVVARTEADVKLENSISTVDAKLGKDDNGIYVDL